tara:strand:- start:215 stop:1105 length:891 start_codon:yes stop_codon:yes gene_type:complete
MRIKNWCLNTALALAAISGSFESSSQGLLDELGNEPNEITNYTYATFKDTKIVNLQSNETPSEGVLHFVIAHRFGELGDGIYELWGLDNAMMRMAFDYGVSDRLAISVARSTHEKTVEASAKYKLLRQSTGAVEMPLSITLYTVAMANGMRWSESDLKLEFAHRLSYAHQVIFTRKFNKNLSLAVVPTVVHRNLVATSEDVHDQFIIGFGGRYKLNHRLSLNGEYNYRINTPENNIYNNSLSLGVDIETGGHVFQLHITNSRGMFERSFLTETAGTWADGNIYFGFNLSRVFNVTR